VYSKITLLLYSVPEICGVWSPWGRSVAQAVSRRLLTVEARFRS
jgi:hypothetical protein